jgi:hypothetical protein
MFKQLISVLGRSLKEYQRRCDEQLRQTQQEHMLLQETTTILAQAEAACQQRERNKMNLARANHELAAAQVRLAHVATQLRKCQALLARARYVGALKRFFLKLDPIRIQAKWDRLERGVIAPCPMSYAACGRG